MRLHAPHGALVVREGLSICFYLRRSHQEIAQAVMRSLDAYLRAVGTQALGWYVDHEGDWQELDDEGWQVIQDKLRESGGGVVDLYERPDAVSRYLFDYRGRRFDNSSPDKICGVAFWLPTDFLEEHGPGRVRELALALGNELPFNSGHAGPSFNFLYTTPEFRSLCFRYPGMDALRLGPVSEELGIQVQGAHWLTSWASLSWES